MKQRPKILISTSTFPSREGDGQPTFILDLAKQLANYAEIFVLTPGSDSVDCQESSSNISIFRYTYFFKRFQRLTSGNGVIENLKRNKFLYLLVPLFLVSQLYHLVRIVRANNIDLINVHWVIPQGLIWYIARPFIPKGVGSITTLHGGDLYRLSYLNSIKRKILSKSDAIIVVSGAMRDFCRDRLGLHDRHIYVRSMGIDAKATFNFHGHFERDNVIFVGRLVEKKGLDVLLKAWVIVSDKIPSIKLTIVGGGNLHVYENLANELGVSENVFFKGRLGAAEVANELRRHQVAIFPSKEAYDGDQEGFGLAAIEAMASGCLLIASNIPQANEYLIDNETGFSFPVGDDKLLAEKILDVFEMTEVQRAAIARKARELVESEFDWGAVGNEYFRIIQKVVHNSY